MDGVWGGGEISMWHAHHRSSRGNGKRNLLQYQVVSGKNGGGEGSWKKNQKNDLRGNGGEGINV